MSDISPAQALFDKLSAIEAKEARLAASILILRDAAEGLQVLMVVRHKEVAFASGAMVYPGGRLIEADAPAVMGDRLSGHDGLSAVEASLRVAAIREAFEEVGMLPAAFAGEVPARETHLAAIDSLRQAIDRGDADFASTLGAAGLRLDVSQLVRFAHIIAPTITPKRFNTHFYATRAPEGQTPRPDGREITESLWITAAEALALADRGERQVMFPTRMVLGRIAQFSSVAEALSGALKEPPQPLQPKLQMRNGVVGLVTEAVPGFPATFETLDMLTGARRQPSA